ncbi:Transthyretin-like family protein [Ancylostoma caninum]|uniref:Transthyretin-like family protein n=1 Tax=Ancylostoma caninum TaxID=29170 RepID=A0A368FUE9_ANCCA|nr:Transthyretin-like family protein [Ancylostoma caninum]
MKPSTVFLLVAIALPQCFAIFGIGRRQSVAVAGRLLCNGILVPGVKVKLYEKEIFLDRLMDEGRTDITGCFYLWGSKTEITNIDPKVNIYHKCNYFGPCYKKFGITIPDNYITYGPHPRAMFNIGTLDLAGRFPGESIDCFN